LTSVDDDWKQFPVAECYELDALCDRFEFAFAVDADTRIEQFAVGLPQPQQRLIVRELVQLEIEQRRTRGESPAPDEYAARFPQWAEEIRGLATQSIADLDGARIAILDTIDQNSGFSNDTKTSGIDLHTLWRDQWQASWDAIRHADLPTDGVLGHYRLQSVIGRGGMGLVVRAHDTKLTRDVAIKILAIAISQDDTVHERFLREARAVAVSRHNHVVTIYAVEEVDRIPFLVMELVEGTTLDEYLRENGKPTASEIASLAYQMAQGLAAAHKQSLIHRDLKPANILLEKIDPHVNGLQPLSTWLVKITDFGLARVAAEVRLTSSGLIAGTPQYMSPEQANGQEIDMRSDLFSLGSVMYAMCAGQAAFQADSALGILRQVAEKPPRSLREVSPQMPAWLIEIIEKLMAKSPDERFQSAAVVAELLSVQVHELQFGRSSTDLATNGKVAVDRAPTGDRTRVRSRTARLLVLAIAGVAIGVLGIAMFFRHDGTQGVTENRAPQVDQADVTAGSEASDKQSWYASPTDAPPPAIASYDAEQAIYHQVEWANYLNVPVEITNSLGMKFRVIPPGEFLMGSSEEEIAKLLTQAEEQGLRRWYTDRIRFEGAQHHVTLTKPFAMSIHEVTRGKFRQFVETTGYETDAEREGQGGSGWKDGNMVVAPDFLWNTPLGFDAEQTDEHPVVNVSWNDAVAFCEWLSEREEVTYRLPTEAEWEYACRAGSITRFTFGDDESQLESHAWYASIGGINTNPVGQKRSNTLGLFDMHGNVFEWCEDKYYAIYSDASAIDPTLSIVAGLFIDDTKQDRVWRGGSFECHASEVRSTLRRCAPESYRNAVIGFRLVRDFHSVP
jgi:formylglycine-generating enzyme required for sulfatase activity/serine/threonine protein kinase